MTTSLVTGGAGFIGSHVARHLLSMGHEVVILDDLSGGTTDNLPQDATLYYRTFSGGQGQKRYFLPFDGTRHCQFVKGSILDARLIAELFEAYPFDYVFHLAAYAAEGLSHFIRRFNYEVNVIGSVNLINAAVNAGTVKRFVFTSSAAVYGHLHRASDGFFVPDPIDPYGVAKYAVEQDLHLAHETFGLEYTVFRPHNVYGPNQNLSDPYRNVIGIFMRQCLRGEPMTIFGDGGQTREFTYIDDVAPYIADCVNLPQTANWHYDIGSEERHTVLSVAATVRHFMERSVEIVHLPERPEAKHITVPHDLFRRDFGVHRSVMFADGIQRMAAWARTQPLREPKPFGAIEIQKGLPDVWKEKSNVD